MSFAHELKEEICRIAPTSHEEKIAQAYGLLLFSKNFSSSSVSIQTENEQAARLFCSYILELVGIKTSIIYSEFEKRNGATVFTASVEAEEDRLNILKFFGHSDEDIRLHICKKYIKDEHAVAAFVAGAYLACGNITDPYKNYHLEFVTQHMHLCKDLIELLREVPIELKLTRRRSYYVAYLKDSEEIEDIMTYMGASVCSISLMNIKIYKDLRNKVNRVTNCETANIEKTVTAAAAQCDDINYILTTTGEDFLPDELRELALLRVENPEMSLREMGEALQIPMTRSGINHRLKRLSAIASELREGKMHPQKRRK
ncbi:MAG: DNA-binding protein WhiA [Hydrogenoanaerobacterium sp.]